jgi:hypothetical protein
MKVGSVRLQAEEERLQPRLPFSYGLLSGLKLLRGRYAGLFQMAKDGPSAAPRMLRNEIGQWGNS